MPHRRFLLAALAFMVMPSWAGAQPMPGSADALRATLPRLPAGDAVAKRCPYILATELLDVPAGIYGPEYMPRIRTVDLIDAPTRPDGPSGIAGRAGAAYNAAVGTAGAPSAGYLGHPRPVIVSPNGAYVTAGITEDVGDSIEFHTAAWRLDETDPLWAKSDNILMGDAARECGVLQGFEAEVAAEVSVRLDDAGVTDPAERARVLGTIAITATSAISDDTPSPFDHGIFPSEPRGWTRGGKLVVSVSGYALIEFTIDGASDYMTRPIGASMALEPETGEVLSCGAVADGGLRAEVASAEAVTIPRHPEDDLRIVLLEGLPLLWAHDGASLFPVPEERAIELQAAQSPGEPKSEVVGAYARSRQIALPGLPDRIPRRTIPQPLRGIGGGGDAGTSGGSGLLIPRAATPVVCASF